jgi:hypothetical protein
LSEVDYRQNQVSSDKNGGEKLAYTVLEIGDSICASLWKDPNPKG